MLPYFTASQGKALEQKVDSKPVGSVVEVSTQSVTGATTINSISIDGTNYNLPQPSSSEPVHIHWEDDNGIWSTVSIENIPLSDLEAIKGKPCRIVMEFNNAGVVQNCTNIITLSTNTAHYSIILCPAYNNFCEWAEVSWASDETSAAITIVEPDTSLGEDCLIKKIDIYSM